MLNGVELPIVGNITRDPELQFSGAGKAWVRFSVAVNRVTNRDGNKVESTTFINCKAFGDFAENIAESLKKGTRVVAYGRFEEESWKSQSGEDRKAMSFLVDEIGPSLRWARTPTVEKVGRTQGGYNNYSQSAPQSAPSSQNYAPSNDLGGFSSEPSLSGSASEDNPFF